MKVHKIIFLTSIKKFNISVDTYAKTCIHTIEVIIKNNKSVLWVIISFMRDIKDKLCVKSMSDLTIKAIKDTYVLKKLAKIPDLVFWQFTMFQDKLSSTTDFL